MSKLKFKYGIGIVSAVTAFAGVAGPQALAGEEGISKASLFTQRAKHEYALQMQECDTLKNSQPQAYEPCLQKAQSARDNLLTQTQGSEHAAQGSQGQFSGQGKQEKGPIDKMTSAVKETVAEVKEFFGSSDQGREGQPGQGQQGQGFAQGQPSQQGGPGGSQPQGQSMGQGQQGGGTQDPNPLQQGFEASHMQGQDLAQQNLSAGGGQGGQNFGQQGLTQGQQPQGQSGQQGTGGTNQQSQGQQGQSGQGSFQGSNYGQQPQGQSGQQGTGGTNQQSQSGGTQGLQGSSNQQGGSMGGWVGEKEGAHMDRGQYYQAIARQQYVTLKQECDTLKQDPNVYEQCRKYAESVREKLVGMAKDGT